MFMLPITRIDLCVGIVFARVCYHSGVSRTLVCIWQRFPYYDINRCSNRLRMAENDVWDER